MKKLSRLTALLLALMMFCTMFAYADESSEVTTYNEYATMLSDVQTYGYDDAIYDGMLEYLAQKTAAERYAFLNSWYKVGAAGYENFVAYYAANASEYVANLICTCVPPVEYGASGHAAGCPWAFASLPVAEQYAMLNAMDAEQKEAYKATLSADELDALNRVNVTEYETQNEGTNVAINVPEGAFAEDYQLQVTGVTVNEALQSAIDAALGEESVSVPVAAYDISFVKLANGSEMQPAAGVPVELTFTIPTESLSIGEDDVLNVYHMVENEDGSYDAEFAGSYAIVSERSEQEVSVKAAEFSIYVVTNGIRGQSAVKNYTMQAGETLTLYSDCREKEYNESEGWYLNTSDSDNSGELLTDGRSYESGSFTITPNGRYVTVTASASGTLYLSYNVTYKSGNNKNKTERDRIAVNAEGPIKVYVYVGTDDGNGGSWADNPEFLELLGISEDTVDTNKYFPVGEIYLDPSYFAGKNVNTVGAALINSEADWLDLNDALSEMDTTTLIGKYAANINNEVPEYLDQAVHDIGEGIGSQKTALFRWNMSTSYGFEDQTVQYHLDLRFNTKKITFITGNNGIASGDAKDGTTVDSRVYITGSEIQEPRNLDIPEGYQFMGYYTDANFTIPWNGIGTPLNENQTVYIKITEMENVVLQYIVAEGDGSVSPYNEAFNPETGVASGSTATPGAGYRFVGWYSDETCTALLAETAVYQPTAPTGGWEPGKTYCYYAKFVPDNCQLTVSKQLSEGTTTNGESFLFKVTGPNSYETTIVITGSGSVTLSQLDPGTYTVEELNWSYGYTSDGNTSSQSCTLSSGAKQTVTFKNKANADKWLHDESATQPNTFTITKSAETSTDENAD